MRLLVIRHGESEADLLNVHEGRADFSLTGRGHAQAAAMSAYVGSHYRLDKIYHSTLRRACQTAQHLADATGAPLSAEEDLMEFDNGLLAGLPRDTARQMYPPVTVPPHMSVYEQESMLQFRFRAEKMLSRLLCENDARSTLAVVSHGGMINQLYRAFFGLPIDAACRFYSGDAALHEWLEEDGVRCLVRANFIVGQP